MITPRRTRLVRVPDLHAFRNALVRLSAPEDPENPPVVIVATRAARRLFEQGITTDGVRPVVVTRDGFYDVLQLRLPDAPRRMTAYERDVVMQDAARSAAGGATVRPGLVVEMLRFYDQLKRQGRNIDRFETLMIEALARDAEFDRGAAKMQEQTRVLTETFREYEARIAGQGQGDEHTLRERLLSAVLASPVRGLVVGVGDWIGDPHGLYLADFDLLTRLAGLERIDLVATAADLSAGFHQRIHDWMPDIEEVSEGPGDRGADRPVLLRPIDSDRPVFVARDREEELIAIARRVHNGADGAVTGGTHAVVYKRPLPYLYLAGSVFTSARLDYRAYDSTPLAAEPFAAAVDLVFEAIESNFTRSPLVALLRSPHFEFGLGRDAIAAFDRALSDVRYLGDLDRLRHLASTWQDDTRLGPVASAAVQASEQLAPLAAPAPASEQIRHVRAFVNRYGRPSSDANDRLARGRAAIEWTLAALTSAFETGDDIPIAIGELATEVRRWIEDQTFDATGSEDVSAPIHLVDDHAARYGRFDDLTIVGLIESDWPERTRRNIFYPVSLLTALGWPSEHDRRAAADARFRDLLTSASRRVAISTITLDDEALVDASPLVDEITGFGLPVEPVAAPSGRVLVEEALWGDTVDLAPLDPVARDWAEFRISRSPIDSPEFHGSISFVQRTGVQRAWSVSALETYLGCPFKFFAQHVMKLKEEPDDEEVMDPRTQGEFMHQVFESFFERWQAEGHGAITRDNLDLARTVFADVVEDRVATLSDTEAALERTRLIGSPAAAGLGEAVLRMEAERPIPVVGRKLEHRLDGAFSFQTSEGARTVWLRGKADRIDLLADGTFRLIDYKLGWPPKNKNRALQLPIYGLCAEQRLDGERGRHWTLGEAAYVAFKGPKRVVPLFGPRDDRPRVLADAQQRLVDTIDLIDGGRFPPMPDDVYRCETCAYAAVCRKDYVDDV